MSRSSFAPTLLMILLALAAACQPPAQEPAADDQPVTVVQDVLSSGTTTAPDGVSIAYSSKGSGEPALVFIHGWSCDRTYWSRQLDAFGAERRVVAVDLAGHGDSGSDRATWSLPAFGGDVAAVVEELGLERVILVGHSMGGPVALEAAVRLPGKAVGVIAVDSLQDADMKWDRAQWEGMLEAYRKDFAGTCRQFVGSMFVETSDPALVEEVRQDMCSAPPAVAIRLLELFTDYDFGAALQAAGVPIRAINAPAMPTDVEGNRLFAPDFDAVIMEGVGHFPMMERPVEFNAHLETAVDQLAAGSGDGGA